MSAADDYPGRPRNLQRSTYSEASCGMRTNLSLHMITADDLEAGGGTKAGLYVAANDGQISFGVGRVALFFDGPTEFAAWLTKLNALAADTPCVVEALSESVIECCAARLPGAELFACTLAANHDGGHAAGESGVRWLR